MGEAIGLGAALIIAAILAASGGGTAQPSPVVSAAREPDTEVLAAARARYPRLAARLGQPDRNFRPPTAANLEPGQPDATAYFW